MASLKAFLKRSRGLRQAVRRIGYARRSLRHRMFGYTSDREQELALSRFLVDPGKLSIDVGAAWGEHTEALRRLGGPIVAIEPNPRLCEFLGDIHGDRVRVIWSAVSSEVGEVALHLAEPSGLSTIHSENPIFNATSTTIKVPCTTLDSLNLGPTGFLKIDVEGHELEVLKGAAGLIARDRPSLLIEAEDRHRPGAVKSVREFLEAMGYGV